MPRSQVALLALLLVAALLASRAFAASSLAEPVEGDALGVHWVLFGIETRGAAVLPAKAPLEKVSGVPGVVQLARVEFEGSGVVKMTGVKVESGLGGFCVRGRVERVVESLVAGVGGDAKSSLVALVDASVVEPRDARVYRYLAEKLPLRSAVVLLASGFGVDPGRWLELLGRGAEPVEVRLVAVGEGERVSVEAGMLDLYDYLYTKRGVERVGRPSWLVGCVGGAGEPVAVVELGVVVDAAEPLNASVEYLLSARIRKDDGEYIVVGYGGAERGTCLAVRRVDEEPVDLRFTFSVAGYNLSIIGSTVLLETPRGEEIFFQPLGSRVSVNAPAGWVLYATREGLVAIWADARGVHVSRYDGKSIKDDVVYEGDVTLAAPLVGWAGPVPVAILELLARGAGSVFVASWPWRLVDTNGDLLVDRVEGLPLRLSRVCVRPVVEAVVGGERVPVSDPRVPDALLAALLHGGPGNATRCEPLVYAAVKGARLGVVGLPSELVTLEKAEAMRLCEHLSPRQAPLLKEVKAAIASLIAFLVGGGGKAPVTTCPPGAEALLVVSAGLYEEYFDGMEARKAALATTWGYMCSAYLEAALRGDEAALSKLADCLEKPPAEPDPLAEAIYSDSGDPRIVARAAELLVSHAGECDPSIAAVTVAKLALRLGNCTLAELALKAAKEHHIPKDMLEYVESHAKLACSARPGVKKTTRVERTGVANSTPGKPGGGESGAAATTTPWYATSAGGVGGSQATNEAVAATRATSTTSSGFDARLLLAGIGVVVLVAVALLLARR